jgi:streptogramin lyase
LPEFEFGAVYLNGPGGVAHGASVAVADTGNVLLRKFNDTGSALEWSTDAGGILASIYGAAVDGSGNVYVTDTSGTLHKFDGSGTWLWATGEAYGKSLLGINDVSCDTSGNVYVADLGNDRIAKFDSAGAPIPLTVTATSCYGVAVDDSGNIYASDPYVNVAIYKFNNSGNILWASTAGGRLSAPYYLDVDSAGNVYVADLTNSKIFKLDADGTYLGSTQEVYGGALKNPWGVAVDDYGNLYVSDTANSRIVYIHGSRFPQ